MTASRPGAASQQVFVIAAAIALGFGALAVLWLFARAFALITLAIALASSLQPIVGRLEKKLPRAAGVIGTYLVLMAAVAAILYVAAPSLSGEASLLTTQLPALADRLTEMTGRVLPSGGDALGRFARDVIPRLLAMTSGFLSAGADVLVVIFLSLYLLLEAPAAHRTLVRLAAPSQRRRLSRLLRKMVDEMGGYIRGVVINGAIVAALTWAALVVVGLDFALPLAVVAFFGELLPYLGPVLAAIPAVAVALADSPTRAFIVALVYVGIQQVEGHVLTPLVMRSQTHISAAFVIVALAMGYTVGGMLGAVTAIPLFAAARVAAIHVLAPAVRHWMHEPS